MIASEIKQWREVGKEAGIKAHWLRVTRPAALSRGEGLGEGRTQRP